MDTDALFLSPQTAREPLQRRLGETRADIDVRWYKHNPPVHGQTELSKNGGSYGSRLSAIQLANKSCRLDEQSIALSIYSHCFISAKNHSISLHPGSSLLQGFCNSGLSMPVTLQNLHGCTTNITPAPQPLPQVPQIDLTETELDKLFSQYTKDLQ